ncbi:DNA-processing protein DprA [Alkalibacillus haloalkaliphilus]|uniref:DNA-processing protein DprA n=1 Tax=Alkalibacillus haloalkaliphilus TaxID=94136 RepID=UPI0029363F69|nr:DNA-processing protein DprA [Alkalibacillus haloalkaliphilus]MDV2580588.1 DNA-processing protein DprA [Alkalibacillus haloalkaliphilus]
MNVKDSLILYILSQFKEVKRRHLFQYIYEHDNFDGILQATPQILSKHLNLSLIDSHKIYKKLHDEVIKRLMWQQFKQTSVLTWFDSQYPESFRSIPDPPLVLYYKGDLSLLHSPMISVIGTRKPSQQAYRKIDHILNPLINQSLTIVSGLADGIDGMSHQYALDHGGKTIAVLGFGFNHIYPAKHRTLVQSIAEKGLLLSEYPPHQKPQKWHFPERNRLISGLSLGTLIIEAAERSGTLITADQALEQGKEVFVISDSIFLEQAKGCHSLIKDGATPVTTADDITFNLPT